MLLTDYTTYAEVRACLGVTSDELDDDTLALEMYARNLLAEIEDIDTDIPADFATIALIDLDVRTAAQQRFYDAVKLFAPYAVALQLTPSLPLIAAKTVTDGKAAVTRDAGAPFKITIERCEREYNRFRTLLDTRYSELNAGSASDNLRPFLAAVTPATDPVTGA